METILNDDRWVYLLIGVVVASLYAGRWIHATAGTGIDTDLAVGLFLIFFGVLFLYPIIVSVELGKWFAGLVLGSSR